MRDRARGVDPLLERTLELQKRLSGPARRKAALARQAARERRTEVSEVIGRGRAGSAEVDDLEAARAVIDR
jgi:pyruvate/2-oxoglutarate dehydrogenase complex dihydrolipoamide acyltransferase (E2) component